MKTSISVYLALFLAVSVRAQENPAAAEKKEVPKAKAAAAQPQGEFGYKMIPLKSLDFSTVEKACRPLLSPEGILTYEKNRGSILVGDYPDNLKKVADFMSQFDKDASNIRIDIDFMNTGSSAGGGLNVDVDFGNGKHNQLIIEKDKLVKPKKITVSPGIQSGTTTRNTSQFIVTKSGSSAAIFAGKTIADPSWLAAYRFIPSTYVRSGAVTVIVPSAIPNFVMRDVGAKLMVLPVLRDDGMIDVEFYPEVSYVDGEGNNQAVRVETISTKLTVMDGQRINIGGVLTSNLNFYKNLFGPQFINRDDNTNLLDMYLKATSLTPGKSSAPSKTMSPSGEDPYNWRR